MRYTNLLLASHGTPGAMAAEQTALDLCEAGGQLFHLIVVPDFWKGMMGDDWLNSARTRITYGRYVEGELEQEIRQHVERLKAAAEERGIRYHHAHAVGRPAECLVEASCRDDFQLVVIGSPRPRGEQGLRSRMELDTLARGLQAPLLVAPHPHNRISAEGRVACGGAG